MTVFPYAGYMVLALLPDRTTPDSVGLYAGLLASSFMFGRFFTAYQWGRLADTYGRLVALQTCLLLSAIFSILFGLSKSMRAALLWRCCLGMCNGLISLTKTMANEVARGEEVWERRIMGLVVGMRSWGLLIAPAAGGFLAEPLSQYPWLGETEWLQDHSWIHKILEEYPFFLPNFVVAAFCLLASFSLWLSVEETLPDDHREDLRSLPSRVCDQLHDTYQQLVCSQPSSSMEENQELLSTNNSPSIAEKLPPPKGKEHDSPWKQPLTRQHMISHWTFSFVTTYIDEAFPLFCMSTVGGLSLSESSIGKIMSIAGFIFVLLQFASFAYLTHCFGLYYSLEIGCIGGTFLCALIPLSLCFRDDGHMRTATILLSVLLGVAKVLHSLFYTSMAVAVNKTVHSRQRARMNSLILVGNSVSKALGPLLAGAYVTFSFSAFAPIPSEYGSLSVWSIVPMLGLVTYIQVRRLHRQVQTKTPVEE